MVTIGICGIFAVIIAIMYLAVKPIGEGPAKKPTPPGEPPKPERFAYDRADVLPHTDCKIPMPPVKEPRTHRADDPLMIDGLPYMMVTKDRKTRHGVETACTFEIDEAHEITKEFRQLEKLKSLAMFGVVDGMGRTCSHEIAGIGLMTIDGTCAVCKTYIRREG